MGESIAVDVAGRTVTRSPDSSRRRLAIAIAVWTLFPATLAAPAALRGAAVPGIVFAAVAALALLAAILARSSKAHYHRLAALLLMLLACPFAVRYIQRIIFARTDGASAVADSPAGFLVGAVVELLFFVPLLGFAQAIWRRRESA